MNAQHMAMVFEVVHGLTPEKVTAPNDLEDGMISFKEFPDAHIQVGYDCVNVVKMVDGNKLRFYPSQFIDSLLYRELIQQMRGE